jgi:MAP3K TRAFs-binding domain
VGEAAVIVVFGGVQADPPGTPPYRFPASQVDDVSARVRSLLSSLSPRLLVGPAASGSDLVFLEQALALGLKTRIVLPFPADRFRQTSVESRGPDWVRRYEHVLAEVSAGRAELEILDEPEDDDDVYVRTNARLLARARDLRLDGEEIVVIVLRPAGSDGSSVTDDLAARGQVAGFLVLDLDCLRPAADRPAAFVVMPYGRKTDSRTGLEIDCDVIFHHVYVPVLQDLDYDVRRSDRETDSGIIHIGMIEAIANSELVIADLATVNPNVLYELGLRHALADKVTVLTIPDLGDKTAAQAPFDISFIRRIPYNRTVDGISDQQAVQAIKALRDVLRDPGQDRAADSPVFTWFEVERVGLRTRATMTAAEQRELQLRKELTRVRARRTPSDLLALAREIDGSTVAPQARQAMRLEIAITLREQGAYAESAKLFEDVRAPEGPLRALWLQSYALALRRLGEREPDLSRAEALWAQAEQLLNELLAEEPPTAETCGIAAGLAKRRFDRLLAAGQRARSGVQLAGMIELYRMGFMAEPWDYYVGINLIASLRLRGQRFSGSETAGNADLAEARSLLPVVRLMAGRLPLPTFWSSVTQAELILHEHLLADSGGGSVEPVIRAYTAALALQHPPDYEKAAYDQLDIFRRAGDPPEFIAAVQKIFPSQPAQ